MEGTDWWDREEAGTQSQRLLVWGRGVKEPGLRSQLRLGFLLVT